MIIFFHLYFLVVGAMFAPGVELMSYGVVPSFVGLAFSLDFGASFMVDQVVWKGFPNHPSSWLGLLLVMIQSATWSVRKKRPPYVLACISKHWCLAYGG